MKVRKIQLNDLTLIEKWCEDYGMEMPSKDFLPEEGLGGFIVVDDINKPIAAMWLWFTNSQTAIPAMVIADKYYRDTNRDEALELLIDFTTQFAEDAGCKFAFAWAKKNILIDKYEKAGYKRDSKPSHELIKQF